MKSNRTDLKEVLGVPLRPCLPRTIWVRGRLESNRGERQESQRRFVEEPPKPVFATGSGLFFLLALFLFSCSDINSAKPEMDFNVSLRYGVLARNELNTFGNTITKDLILDGTVTVPLFLSKSDLDSIKTKMDQIGFFNYPDTFTVRSGDTTRIFITPNNTYDFKVKSHSTLKTLLWDDAIIANDTQATKLRGLITLIRGIVESKPEYQKLPPARGGYL